MVATGLLLLTYCTDRILRRQETREEVQLLFHGFSGTNQSGYVVLYFGKEILLINSFK